MKKVNLTEAFASIQETWSPRIAAQVNDVYVKLAKLEGEFVRHTHQDEDELFYVLSGTLIMAFDDGDVTVGPGEFISVPRGVAHKPVAPELVEVLLIEPATTVNTGDAGGERTKEAEWL